MILFEKLTEQEQLNISMSNYVCTEMQNKLKCVLELLEDSPLARSHALRISFGNYIINSSREIAQYCIDCAEKNAEHFYVLG